MQYTDDIIELNRDVEPYVVQASATRTAFFKNKFDDRFQPLNFVHFADIHNVLDLWNRMVQYINHYSDYISFALHTGDYCGNSQPYHTDFYNVGTPCVRPILNCVGNHDTYRSREEWVTQPKETTHALLFDKTDDWGVEFLDCPHSMTYYKDFAASNIRLIVTDLYYDIPLQKEWLRARLAEAREQGLCVVTAMHETTAHVNDTYGVTFHTAEDYIGLNGKVEIGPFEEEIVEFIRGGGVHICNLAGHHHHDLFGLTDAGVLNVAVPCGTDWAGWCDGKRVKGTRTYDCFNYVSIDPNLGHIKLVRIGDNLDHFLRLKRSLCFDYVNHKVISND